MKLKDLKDLLRESFTHPFSSSVVVENDEGNRVVLRERGNCSRVNLSGANLSGFKLTGIDLSDANLSGANLSGTNLSGANLRRAKLRGANLRGAIITGANLDQAVIEKDQIDSANYTIKPLGISREILVGASRKSKGRK